MAQNSVYQTYPQPYGSMQYQYSNVQISLSSAPGVFFPFIVSVDYSDTNEIAEGRGASPYRMGKTLGEYKASGSIEVQKLYNEQFLAIVAKNSPGGNSIYDAIFDITVAYQLRTPPNIPSVPVTQDVLRGCSLTGQAQTLSAGNAVLTVKHSLDVSLILWNGRLPLAGLPL